MDFKLRINAKNHSDIDLLNDLKRVAGLLKKKSLTQREYNTVGNFAHKTFCMRFGSWNKALEKADLIVETKRNISTKELFNNLEAVWRTVGRQPLYNEMRKPLSDYSMKPYENRFGSWYQACKKFIEYKKGDIQFIKLSKIKPKINTRSISEKTRLKILKRDNYKCVKCGRSPATHLELYLHIDHIKPFSRGGDNSMENLQTLCNKCNLGKGNDESV